MSRTHRTLLLPALLLAVVLAACADPDTAPAAGESGAQPEAGMTPPADPDLDGDTGEPEPPTTSPERRDARPAPEGCSEPVVEAVGTTIDAQLAAFARGDFLAALAEASPGFQAGIDPETFQVLIERDYALLLEDASAEVEGCAQLRPDISDVVAVIATADGTRTRFAYRLRLADDRWGIDAAVRLDPPPATA
jgi:hypothetical protein